MSCRSVSLIKKNYLVKERKNGLSIISILSIGVVVLCFPYLLAHNRRLRLLIILSMKRIFRAATKIQESLREGLVGRPEFGLKVPMERSMMVQ